MGGAGGHPPNFFYFTFIIEYIYIYIHTYIHTYMYMYIYSFVHLLPLPVSPPVLTHTHAYSNTLVMAPFARDTMDEVTLVTK